MARVVVIGAGVCGLNTAMLLAHDGYEVTVLERDPAAPPDTPDEMWDGWERRGVNQFRMIHMFLPRFRAHLEAELPDAAREFEKLGAIRYNPFELIPAEITGGYRDSDKRFEALTARRPVAESALTRAAVATPGVEIRRGVAVAALTTGTPARDGIPHVTGVRTESGETLTADLVIDAAGRRSALPKLLTEIGARAPEEEVEDSGFMYYARHFRSPTGEIPPAICGLLSPWGSISTLTLPADNGTYGLGIITSAKDAAMRPLRDTDTWMRTWKSLPLVAHWADGEPIDGDEVAIMAKIEDRHRSFVVDGAPVATGVLAVGDSWACTNPSLGRGTSIGFIHIVALRDLFRETGLDDPVRTATEWHEVTATTAGPWFRATLEFDRHRLAEIEAIADGKTYEPDDPGWEITNAMLVASGSDGDVLRAALSVAGVLDLPETLLAEPGLLDKIIAGGAGWRDAEIPAPNREELLAIVAG